ncbi:MAG: glycolate oxidase subunit GlcF [Gammaproteobacteria bacterium]|nr:glycolate oxidase subunit GlcF [Gammaproteobacteria bacterium]
MQTQLAPFAKNSKAGRRAEEILRQCVHCGFCTATCPTYQLLGDELDGPRGRIYLIKQFLEGQTTGEKTRSHLDRCLHCRSCETTCPSGVEYGQLLEIGKQMLDETAPRSTFEQLTRKGLAYALSDKKRFSALLKVAAISKPFLPKTLKNKLPKAISEAGNWPSKQHPRTMLILDGCVQPSLSPNINSATARILDRLGITLIRLERDGCCGAVNQHLGQLKNAKMQMKQNIDLWWPEIEAGAEALVTTASGCGAFIQQYAEHLADEPEYADKAKKLVALCKDIAEIVNNEDLQKITLKQSQDNISYHPPCTLQHWQQQPQLVEKLLSRLGFKINPLKDGHLCCGSAGTYAITQPKLSQQLQERKLAQLTCHPTEMIVSANIGCINHLQAGCDIPVKHWVELLDEVV